MNDQDLHQKHIFKITKYGMKTRRTKAEPKSITITVERLSDNSHITFTISSDKTIAQLRALLNHHLPPLSPNKFDLYSYQRGALIHFHPSSFKLDYFPVIFDQSVLLLKMDDRIVNNADICDARPDYSKLRRNSKKNPCSILRNFLSNKTSMSQTKLTEQSTPPKTMTCLSLLKQFFHQSSSTDLNEINATNILT